MVHSFFDLSAASTMYLWGTLQSAGVPRAGDPPIGEMMAAVEMLTATTSSLRDLLHGVSAAQHVGVRLIHIAIIDKGGRNVRTLEYV